MPQEWVLESLAAYRAQPTAITAVESSESLAARYISARTAFRKQRDANSGEARGPNPANILTQEVYAVQVRARIAEAVDTSAPFVERLVHFWANHFAVSADNPALRALAGTLEFEAIRPHVLGSFAEMLLAVERHPAMQLYLDQAKSAGPNSELGRKAVQQRPGRAVGLNENLAREILELHTVGVRYDQDDVTELARALTGWTINGFGPEGDDAEIGRFVFRSTMHEPGARVLLGKQYAEGGEEQAMDMLLDLAVQPATARKLAAKLGSHFVADEPPLALVDRLARVFLETGGNLPAVYRALIEAEEAWAISLSKFKSPWEWMISALRGLAITPQDLQVQRALSELGQPTWQPRSPAGWPEAANAWAGGYALLHRVRIAKRLAHKADNLDARAIAPVLLRGVLSDTSRAIIARADSRVQGLALLLSAPEFLRR